MRDDSWHACTAIITLEPPLVNVRITETLTLLPRFRSLDAFELRTLARHLDEIADYAEGLAGRNSCAPSDDQSG
jgi:hypothetical protein